MYNSSVLFPVPFQRQGTDSSKRESRESRVLRTEPHWPQQRTPQSGVLPSGGQSVRAAIWAGRRTRSDFNGRNGLSPSSEGWEPERKLWSGLCSRERPGKALLQPPSWLPTGPSRDPSSPVPASVPKPPSVEGRQPSCARTPAKHRGVSHLHQPEVPHEVPS